MNVVDKMIAFLFIYFFWQSLNTRNVKCFILVRHYDVQYLQALLLIQLEFMYTRFIFIHLLLQRNHLAGSKKKKKRPVEIWRSMGVHLF